MNLLLPASSGGDARELPGRDLVAPGDARTRREEHRRRWEFAAFRWRALYLARRAFGPGARLGSSTIRPGGYRGVLRLQVPFDSLDDHRYREAQFIAWAARDPVLGPAPIVYFFTPDPAVAVAGDVVP